MRKLIIVCLLFSVCQSIAISQPINDDCENAIPIGPIITNDIPVCLSGSTFNANPEELVTGCNMEVEETVWYTTITDIDAGFLNIHLFSNSIEFPTVQIFQGSSCGFFQTLIDCKSGKDGEVNIWRVPAIPNTQYYVAVSQLEGAGDFEICMSTNQDNETCNMKDTLIVISTSMGSPLDGPYMPGEEVSFEYTLFEWKTDTIGGGNNCQYLKGIVPIFGNGWDPTSFNSNGQPLISDGPNTVAGASWVWFTEASYNEDSDLISIGDFNGFGFPDLCYINEVNCGGDNLIPSTILPPGWFAVIPGQGDVNNSFGDGSGCGLSFGPWQVSFTLKAIGPGECESVQDLNCDVKMFTFGDAEVGPPSNADLNCDIDIPVILNANLDCCDSLGFANAFVCTGDSLQVVLSNDSIIFDWEVATNINVIGAVPGRGHFINQHLVNLSDTVQTITYTINAPNDLFCENQTSFQVFLYPALEVGNRIIDACILQNASLAFDTYNGSGSYNFNWETGGADSIEIVFIDSALSVTAIVEDANSKCLDTASIEVQILEVPRIDISIIESGRLVDFFSNTIGIDSVVWDFGDQVQSSDTIAQHIYSADADYTITYRAYNKCTTVDTSFILPINTNALLGFNASNRSVCAPTEIQFFDSSRADVSSWEWSFPGGIPDTSNEMNPIVLYTDMGKFDVSLTVSNGNLSSSMTFPDYVEVNEKPNAAYSFI
ncbi:MAG: PKD domain-containing protein, partial [Bacteroidota bacterium]